MVRSELTENRIYVLVSDNSVMGTQLLADALARDRQLVVLRTETNSADLSALPEIDVAVISANLQGKPDGGCEFVKQLHACRPEIRSLILIDDLSRKVVVEAFRAGARGVFHRNEPVQALRKCIHSIYQGQIWANQAQLSFVLQALNEPIPMRLVDAKGRALLSSREQDVVRWVVEGLNNREIAERLGLSGHTVKNYLFKIFEKLGISNRVELILYAMSQLVPQSTALPAPGSEEETRLTLCSKAAGESCGAGCYELAEIYRRGHGVAADLTTAMMWYTVAEAMSNIVGQKSKTARQQISAQLTVHQIAEADRRAAEWLQAHEPGSAGEDSQTSAA